MKLISSRAVLVWLVQTVLAYWNTLDIQLPEAIHSMAVGVINDSVFLAGGFTYKNYTDTNKNLIKYAIDIEGALGSLTNVLNYFPDNLQALGQSCVQHGNQLFIAHAKNPEIAVFDMAKEEYTSAFATVPDDVYWADFGCFVHTGSHLVITGGQINETAQDSVYTYNIDNGNWDNFVASMNEVRWGHSCVYTNNKIFAIAGGKYDTRYFYYESIEYVNLNSPSQWIKLDETLEGGGGLGTRSVVYQDKIYIIGGIKYDSKTSGGDLVFILDSDDGSVSLGESLPYAVAYSACAVIQESIVCFGGQLDQYGAFGLPIDTTGIIRYDEPTASPTAVPTEVTMNPTRYPTASIIFEHVLEAEYKITNLTEMNLDTFQPEAITKIIEYSYVENSNLLFIQFEIREKSHDVFQSSLSIRTSINFNDDVVRTTIPLISIEDSFISNATTYLRQYFDNPFVVFSVVDSQTNDLIDSLNYVLYGLGALLFASGIISLFAMLQNKLPKSSIDNANWKMAMTFAWQMFDFVSDINLTIELALEVVDNQDILLIICTIGCALFVIVPFITNLTMAARIKSLVANNDAAVSYFDRNSALFVSLCIVSGAVYPSLQLVSSRLFGLDIFDCGLTSYELKKMIHLKVMGSVVLENVPQVMFQVLYIGYSEGIPSNVVLLSLVASLLSIVAALMTWIVERNASNCATVQYHIKIERKGKQLTKDERDTIKQKKERKKSLTKKLCQALSIQDRQMEIGYATINAFGFNYSVIHSVFPSEYGMNSEGGMNSSDEEKVNEHVLAMDYVKDLYAKQAQAAVTQVFLDYFDIVGFEVSVVPVSALYSVANGAVSSDASTNIELHMSSTLGDPSDEKDCETISK